VVARPSFTAFFSSKLPEMTTYRSFCARKTSLIRQKSLSLFFLYLLFVNPASRRLITVKKRYKKSGTRRMGMSRIILISNHHARALFPYLSRIEDVG